MQSDYVRYLMRGAGELLATGTLPAREKGWHQFVDRSPCISKDPINFFAAAVTIRVVRACTYAYRSPCLPHTVLATHPQRHTRLCNYICKRMTVTVCSWEGEEGSSKML